VRGLKAFLASVALAYISIPTQANEWVSGTVSTVWDYGGSASTFGDILITLTQMRWFSQGGDTTDGQANCTQRFRILNGVQGVDASSLSRFDAMLITAYTTQQPITMYVDTNSTAPYCAVAAVVLGTFF
jgi:hypothetical protein